MCGICGFTGRLLTSEEILENMMNKIIHRGPDSGGKHIDDGVSMGFRRLSIIDLEGGTQPIYNENRDMVITFNGEIYNHQELREDLIAKGHVMGSHADTEVLLHGYEASAERLPDSAARQKPPAVPDRQWSIPARTPMLHPAAFLSLPPALLHAE